MPGRIPGSYQSRIYLVGFRIISRKDSPAHHQFSHFASLRLIGTDTMSSIYAHWKHQVRLLKPNTFWKYLYACLIFHTFWAHVTPSESTVDHLAVFVIFLRACKQKAVQLQWALFRAVRVLADYTGEQVVCIFLGVTKPKKMSCNLQQCDLRQNWDFSGIQVVFLSESYQLMRAKQSVMTAANEKKVLQEERTGWWIFWSGTN